MISLKKYLDSAEIDPGARDGDAGNDLLLAIINAYRSALLEMGNCGMAANPGLSADLKQSLAVVAEQLCAQLDRRTLATAEGSVREQLREWGRGTARHYQRKAEEVKGILLLMVHTAESVGRRDQRAAQQISEVTTRLKGIANLEDLTEIRASIEKSASDLKTSIDRITAEGKAAMEHLRVEVSTYQAKLEEAEYIASCDALTGLGSRLWIEGHLQRQIDKGTRFCAAIIDIDDFKRVNDRHGHLVGDDLLKQFATELKSVCRSSDILGRWGGDEFLVLLDCGLAEARAQTDRLRKWVCGSYTVQARSGPQKINVDASIGLAEQRTGETSKQLLDRADAEMYENKATSRAFENVTKL